MTYRFAFELAARHLREALYGPTDADFYRHMAAARYYHSEAIGLASKP